MAVITLSATYNGAGLANPASGLIYIPSPGDITLQEVTLDLNGNTDGDAVFNLRLNGIDLFTTELTVADGTALITASGLSQAAVLGDTFELVLDTMPTTLPAPPWGLILTYDDGTTVDVAAAIHAATGKTTPVDADELGIADSAASWVLKKLTWANLKATAKSYFDTLYQPVDSDLTTIAGLTATTDNFLQAKSSAWASRTVAQVKTDLGLTGTNSGDQNLFQTISVSGQSDVVADSTTDTLTLAAGSNVTITTNAGTDTITIAATGGSGSVATDTIFDAKGDLAVGTGADTAAKLSVGANGTVLVADSGQATGVKWDTVSGTGTVTATGGSLTSNAVVLGAGSTDTKVVAGIITDGTSKVTLGVAGSSVGSVDFKNATSGTVTLSPVTGALGTATLSLPAATDTLVGKATTDTLTNKTYDAEGTGNVFTYPERIWLPAAGTNGTTPATMWDLPASDAPTATDVTGTNIHKGVLSFADSGAQTAQTTLLLPADWTGAIDAKIIWYTTATSGNCKWFLYTGYGDIGAGATDDGAFNAAQTVTTAAPGTGSRITNSAIASLTTTGATAGYLFHLKIGRDGTDGSDTIGAAALLVGVEIVWRRTI